MKRILLSILILSMSLFLFGDPVDENTAKHLAQNFWKENNIMGVKGDKIFKKKMDEARFVNVAPQCGYSEFYIFNNEDDKGFVIIAADDCVTPILGYSYDNNFDAENLPPNLKSWLDGYAEQIQAAVEMRAEASEEIALDWNCLRQGTNLPIKSVTAVNSLLSDNIWSQKCYYNSLCPSNVNGPCNHTLTGCTGTAMAQIMHYWNYPSTGNNSTSYTPNGYPTQSVNFGESSYNWDNMPNSLTGTTPNQQVTEVAKLLWHCGVALHAAYGPNITTAQPADVPNALRNYFKYANDCYGEQKGNNIVWLNKVKACLDIHRPIHYSAWTSNNEGHSFVCDGYDEFNCLSFNWGWGGTDNGYYALTALNVGGHQYNHTHYAIFDIHTPDIPLHFDLVLNHDIEMLNDGGTGNIHFGEDIVAFAEVMNSGNAPFSGYIGAAVFDHDAYLVDFLGVWDRTTNPLQPNYYQNGNFTHAGGIPFIPSHGQYYYTKMMYSTDGQDWSFVELGDYQQTTFNVIISNDIQTNSGFTLSNGETDALYHGETTTINIDVINTSTNNYNGDIWLALIDANESSIQLIESMPVYIPAGGSFQNGLNFTNIIRAPEGLYYLALFYHDSQNNVRYVGSVSYENIKPVYVHNWLNIIEAVSNPIEGGAIGGAGVYHDGESCTLSATPNNGYTFVNWTENGTQISPNASYTFTVTRDRSFVANFHVQQQYTISVSADPSDGGGVTGGGTYIRGTSCTVHATANNGYIFVNWTENGTQVSTNADYTFTVTNDRSLVAHFQQQPQQYTISVSANPSNGGRVTGGGTYNQDASCTVHATANSGYTFVNWTENGAQVSTNADYTFTVTGDRSLVAHFQQQQYTISVSADPSNGGNVTGGGTYDQNASCTVHATANNGYTFVNWTENGAQVSANADYTFTVTGNRRLVAHFQAQQQQYSISVTASPSNGGSVTGGGTYDQGASCSVHATANSGYTFVNWNENGTQVSTNANYTFSVTGNRSLVAHFQAQQQQYSISVTASPSNGGNVTGGGTYDQGASCAVHATANSSYTFVNWTENGAQVSTDAEYAFTVTGNRRLVAHFQAQQQYTISVSADPSNGGSVTGGGTYNQGASCTVHATANSDFTFVNWTENGAQVSTNADYTFSITGSRSLVAHFQQNQQQYSIDVSADPSNGGSVTGGGTYNQGASCTVHATANSGYTFVSWTENGTQVSINADYTFSVTGNRSLVAHFQQQQQEYSISVTASPSDGGSVRGGGTYSQGASCTVRATANNGFSFTNWTESGMQVSTNANYAFTVTNNRNLVANFAQNTHTIQASAGAKGIITPSGSITVAHGASQSFSMIPNSGYEVQELYIDGNPVGAMTSYTFTNVTTDHNIHVTFTHVDAVAEHDNNLINIYPNPTQGDVMVEGEGLSHVRIVNTYGQTVYNGDVEGDHVRINLSQMAKGIYMMHIEANGGQTVRKIVVE